MSLLSTTLKLLFLICGYLWDAFVNVIWFSTFLIQVALFLPLRVGSRVLRATTPRVAMTVGINPFAPFSFCFLIPVTSEEEQESLSRTITEQNAATSHSLPSNSLSIYQSIPKEARPVLNHEITPMWCKLGQQIYTFFDSIHLLWMSIDPVRFGKEPGPLFLWVGVLPGTLSPNDAKNVAVRCKEIISELGITDVEIAFRESTFTQFTPPWLLNHFPSNDGTGGIRDPFTPALGLQIAPKTFPSHEGTGCLYLREGRESNWVFLLTARHVALPPNKFSNTLYHRKNNSTPHHEVIHLGERALHNAVKAIEVRIAQQNAEIDDCKIRLAGLGEAIEGEDAETTTARQEAEVKLAQAEESKARVSKFQRDIDNFWMDGPDRILGHVLYSPPIFVGTGDNLFTEDWALIELIPDKFNWDIFRGNVINLGSTFRPISLRLSRV